MVRDESKRRLRRAGTRHSGTLEITHPYTRRKSKGVFGRIVVVEGRGDETPRGTEEAGKTRRQLKRRVGGQAEDEWTGAWMSE